MAGLTKHGCYVLNFLGAQNTFRRRFPPRKTVGFIAPIFRRGFLHYPPGVGEIKYPKGEIARCSTAVLSTRSFSF